jgi:pimeloyl-ACP methyl ester carboxylesterase
MKLLLWIVLALLAAGIGTYLLFPRMLFNQVRGALRRKGGMALKSVLVGDIAWPYLEGGNPAGKAVVLVHGFGGDKDNWSFYAPYMTGEYRLICPDLPGFGESAHRLDLDHAVTKQAERLRDFLDCLGVDKCHLGGNSMGGYIALHFALEFPDRLHSLTLFNNAGVIGPDESELQKIVEADIGGAGAGASPLVPRTLAEMDQLMGFVVHKPRYIPGQFKKLMFEEHKPHQALLDSIFKQLIDDVQNRPLNDRLGDVRMPTQIIWGRQDRLVDVSCATVQHDGIKDSELVIFEDVGHLPMIEAPAETARHHLAFLAKH